MGRLGRFIALFLLVTPRLAFAQLPIESVGSRAQGMAGAFVAVADDATAPVWNPAGLATGAPVGGAIDLTRFQSGNRTSFFAGLGTWPLGLGFHRQGATFHGSRFQTSTLAANVLQTVFDGVNVGATLKMMRGTVDDSQPHSSTEFDIDLGAMASFEHARVGIALRNLTQPSFTNAAGISTRVPRQFRAGAAWLPKSGVTLALDLDLDTVGLWDGPRRGIAVGGEARVSTRLSARGGVRWNTADGAKHQPAFSAGASVKLSAFVALDTHYTYSQDRRERAFGAALRAGY